MTLVLYDLSFASAGRADALCLHHSEQALRGVGHDSAAMTCRTCLRSAARLGTAAVAMAALYVFLYLELLGYSR